MQITIYTKDRVAKNVNAEFVAGDFAAHSEGTDWQVTHVTTGRCLVTVGKLAEAKNAVKKLAEAKSFSEGLSIFAQILDEQSEKYR
jgi:soluble cytochrome b562